jgi:hypothetical protein
MERLRKSVCVEKYALKSKSHSLYNKGRLELVHFDLWYEVLNQCDTRLHCAVDL